MSRYLPIDCGLHSEYELLAMHRKAVDVHWVDEFGKTGRPSGRVMDIFTRNQAEYLRLAMADGDILDIRLDRIRKIRVK